MALQTVVLGGAILFLSTFILSPLMSKTRSIPGPFLARFTRLWYFYRTYDGKFDQDNIALHKTYGPIFRYAPNQFSVADPAAIREIYGHGKELDKSPWYESFVAPNGTSLFTEQRVKIHGVERRKYNNAYSMSTIVQYEPFTDTAIDLFARRLDEMAGASNKIIDMGWWFMCFAGDAIALITFSERYGFLDKGEDQQDLISAMHKNLTYSSTVGIFQGLHAVLFPLTALLARVGLMKNTGRATLLGFTGNVIRRREADRKEGKAVEKVVDDEKAPEDFVNKFLDAHEQNPTHFTRRNVESGLNSNVVAGADTTAASLSAILYHLLKNPETLIKLRREIDEKWTAGEISSPPSFRQTQAMPYLQAVIQEGLRVHPAVGLPLTRLVPERGLHICGHDLPAGAWVGANAWVLHHDTDIFGEDAAKFRPERWLEADKETLSAMHRFWMPFGLASRTCIGKNISMLEMSKVLPEMIRRFDFELSPDLQERDWKTINHWFVIPIDFNVTITRREA